MGITIVPMNIHFGDHIFKDLVDLENSAFYRKLTDAAELPTTSAPPVERYRTVFENIVKAGCPVFCLTVSSGLSNSYNCAVQAAAELAGEDLAPIKVFDTQGAGAAASLLVVEAATLAAGGATLEQLELKLAEPAENATLIGMIDTLEFIRRSGRVGRLAAFAGDLFKIKPLIFLRGGKPSYLGRARGRAQGLKMILAEFEKRTRGAENLRVAVTHAGVEEDALLMAEKIKAAHPGLDIDIVPFTPAMGVHTGPGVIGLGLAYTGRRCSNQKA